MKVLGILFSLGVVANLVAQTAYAPASIAASPGLQCKIYPAGGTPSSGITVFTDDDGYARFHAVRAGAGHPVQRLTLDCTNSAGKSSSYSVDLTAETTFAPRPLKLAAEHGVDRPALKGDPLRYTQSQLIQAGYGLRPDPKKEPAAYAHWLAAASVSARMLDSKRPATRSHSVPPPLTRLPRPSPTRTATGALTRTVTPATQPWWVGSVLTGAPSYVSTETTFNVPFGIPGAAQTTNTEMTIWNGLGGYNSGSGLIQGGVTVRTTPSVASYSILREYCCGDPNENDSGIGAFVPNPGDKIFSQEWYCDATGNLAINGGYGCTLIVDLTSLALLNCTSATGSPCASVKASPLCSVSPATPNCMTLGTSAEFIIENQSPQVGQSNAFTVFTPTVDMAGSAYSSQTGTISVVGSDPNVVLLTESTNVPTHVNVNLGNADTYFNWIPVWASQQVGIGGGSSVGPSLAVFQNRLYAAWKGVKGDQRMFWSSFDGNTWTPQQVGIGGGTSQGPSLAVFQDRLYAAWKGVEGDQRMFWSSFDGNTWTPQQPGIGGGTSVGPSLAVFQNRLYAAWKGLGSDQRMFWSSFDGNTWTPQQVGIGGGTSTGPSLAVFQNRLYAAWKGLGSDQRMFWSSFDGNTWAPPAGGYRRRHQRRPIAGRISESALRRLERCRGRSKNVLVELFDTVSINRG